MDWNGCWSVNTVTPFLFESTGDSEDIKTHVDHDQQQHDADMNESEGLWFRFDDPNDVDVEEDDDDDAQSCSYDHSSYINNRCESYDGSQHDLSQRSTNGDHEESNIEYEDDDDEDDKNEVESKLMESSKKQKRSHNFCVDLLNQREIDRKFWEACLAS